MRVLILGIGNILLGDEGLGVRAVEAMREMHLPDHVEVQDGGTCGIDLVDMLAGREKVIVIDAMDAGCAPGSVLRLRYDDLQPIPTGGISLHEIGLLHAMQASEFLGCRPHQLVIYAVQPEHVKLGLELSDCVRRILPRVMDLAIAEAGVP